MRQPPTAVRSVPSLSSSVQSESEADDTQNPENYPWLRRLAGAEASLAQIRPMRSGLRALGANRLSHGEAGFEQTCASR